MAILYPATDYVPLQGDGSTTTITYSPTYLVHQIVGTAISGGLGGFTVSNTSVNGLTNQVTLTFSPAPPAVTGTSGTDANFVVYVYYTTSQSPTFGGVAFVQIL